jgi:hypothetical protein
LPCGPAMLVTHGPMLPTCALQQVVSFLGYTGRAAEEKKNDANDPFQTCTPRMLSRLIQALERIPHDLNRKDSQSVSDERVCQH